MGLRARTAEGAHGSCRRSLRKGGDLPIRMGRSRGSADGSVGLSAEMRGTASVTEDRATRVRHRGWGGRGLPALEKLHGAFVPLRRLPGLEGAEVAASPG